MQLILDNLELLQIQTGSNNVNHLRKFNLIKYNIFGAMYYLEMHLFQIYSCGIFRL